MAEPRDITPFLAIYAASVSTFSVGWNFYRDLLDKGRLKVAMGIRQIVQSPDGKWYQVNPDLPVKGASGQLFLVANVTNIGRRPVRWDGWGGTYHTRVNGEAGFSIVPRDLPKMLNEGDCHSEFTADILSAIENVKRFFIRDASGKRWYLSRRAVRKLKQDIKSIPASKI